MCPLKASCAQGKLMGLRYWISALIGLAYFWIWKMDLLKREENHPSCE